MPMDDVELAFENGLTEDTPQTLWRVTATREHGDRRLRHTNWFATEEQARQYEVWIADGRGDVIAVAEYKLQK